MVELAPLRARTSALRLALERFVLLRVARHFRRLRRERSPFLRALLRLPMNYVRVTELPLALALLGARSGEAVFDLSSPKLAALFLAGQGARVTTSDITDGFVADLAVLQGLLGMELSSVVLDGRAMPFADGVFDCAYSISVIEHIPGDGDMRALAELARVLRPGGRCVVTLPAWREPLEEWDPAAKTYWADASVADATGRVFFQRRYDVAALDALVATSPLVERARVFIAERPLERPTVVVEGRLRHNGVVVAERLKAKWLRPVRRRAPFVDYLVERVAAGRQYLTLDGKDPNVRQVAVLLVKPDGR